MTRLVSSAGQKPPFHPLIYLGLWLAETSFMPNAKEPCSNGSAAWVLARMIKKLPRITLASAAETLVDLADRFPLYPPRNK